MSKPSVTQKRERRKVRRQASAARLVRPSVEDLRFTTVVPFTGKPGIPVLGLLVDGKIFTSPERMARLTGKDGAA